jgi:hypothetical protein
MWNGNTIISYYNLTTAAAAAQHYYFCAVSSSIIIFGISTLSIYTQTHTQFDFLYTFLEGENRG